MDWTTERDFPELLSAGRRTRGPGSRGAPVCSVATGDPEQSEGRVSAFA